MNMIKKVVFYLFLTIFCSLLFAQTKTADYILTQEEVISDCNEMITYVEAIHPFFLREKKRKAEYKKAKKEYLDNCQKTQSVWEFSKNTSEFLTFFNDGHTHLNLHSSGFLEPVFYYDGENLFADENLVPVTEINSIPLSEIFELLDILYPAENIMCIYKNYEIYSRNIDLLDSLRKNDDKKYTLTFADGTKTECKVTVEPKTGYSNEQNTIKLEDDIVIIDYNQCNDDFECKVVCIDLQSYLMQGYKKVIVDVRGNGGGNSVANDKLLETMGMTASFGGVYERFSQYTAQMYKEAFGVNKPTSGHQKWKTGIKNQQNPDINLVVLTDRYTFSSAMDFATCVSDAHLGILVGEPSSNSPSSYGDNYYFSLKNSGLSGSISHKYFMRNDTSKNNELLLKMDISTDPKFAMEEAKKYLKK